MKNSENKYNIDPTILKALIDQGPDFLMELFRMAMNEAIRLEREAFLNAGAYERTEGRLGYANGFKPKTVNMRSGSVALSIPRTRDCDFYPRSLAKGLRSERTLTLAMAEMYVQGVSTRKVKTKWTRRMRSWRYAVLCNTGPRPRSTSPSRIGCKATRRNP